MFQAIQPRWMRLIGGVTFLLTMLAGLHKPMLVVLNKIDLYSPPQRQRLLQVLREERLQNVLAPEDIVAAAADPREVEYVILSPDGRSKSEWRRPEPDVSELKIRILEILDRDGLGERQRERPVVEVGRGRPLIELGQWQRRQLARLHRGLRLHRCAQQADRQKCAW